MTLETMFNRCIGSPEHPVYHPEKTLENHILLVALKCFLVSGDTNLVLAGFLHDIFKPFGVLNTELGYISNPDHPKQSSEFIIEDDDTRYMIKQLKGDPQIISDICLHHMSCKEKIIKKAKHIPFMDLFVTLDDMIWRKSFPVTERKEILLKDQKIISSIFFIGQSPLQIANQKEEFTVTLNRLPMRFSFKELPEFFENTKYKELANFLKS